mgnify:CR=1 FL=1
MTNLKINRQSGFTLLEVLVAAVAVAIVGLITTGILFGALSFADRVAVNEVVEESGRILTRTVVLAVESALDVTGGGTNLETISENECWRFLWQEVEEKLYYDRVEAGGCSPNPSPGAELLAEDVQVRNLSFDLQSIETGGEAVKVSFTLKMTRPLAELERSFSFSVLNLVDD